MRRPVLSTETGQKSVIPPEPPVVTIIPVQNGAQQARTRL